VIIMKIMKFITNDAESDECESKTILLGKKC
jgi:hypothetical protein